MNNIQRTRFGDSDKIETPLERVLCVVVWGVRRTGSINADLDIQSQSATKPKVVDANHSMLN